MQRAHEAADVVHEADELAVGEMVAAQVDGLPQPRGVAAAQHQRPVGAVDAGEAQQFAGGQVR